MIGRLFEQDSDSIFCCRLVWIFAIRAVLQDLGKHRRWLTPSDLAKRRHQRLYYQRLYLKRLEQPSNGAEGAKVFTSYSSPLLCLVQ